MFAGLGIASFAAAMVATMPASVFLTNQPWRSGVAGTVWNGEVGVAGGSVLRWRWAPLRSLTSLGFAVDWRAMGGDADLGGQAILRPGGARLDAVSGSADASLLEALRPGLPFMCDAPLQVDLRRVRTGAGAVVEGNVRIAPGSCATRPGGIQSATPAMLLIAEPVGSDTRIRLVPEAQRRRTLIDATLRDDGTMALTMTPDGAVALPFTGLPGGVTIDAAL